MVYSLLMIDVCVAEGWTATISWCGDRRIPRGVKDVPNTPRPPSWCRFALQAVLCRQCDPVAGRPSSCLTMSYMTSWEVMIRPT
jgi:hypothetical protein